MSYENSFSISIPMDERMGNLIKYIMKSVYIWKKIIRRQLLILLK